MEVAATILDYCWNALFTTLLQVLVILGPGLILTVIMSFTAGFIERRSLAVLGRGWYLALFGWLGTAVHELAHALFCFLFGHQISEIKLFDPDPESGTLGYVRHSYNSRNLYQLSGNFFIGIGPILFGTAAIYLVFYMLIGTAPLSSARSFIDPLSPLDSGQTLVQLSQELFHSALNLLSGVFSWHNIASWRLYVFIYLAFAVGSSITLSSADVSGTLKGFAVIFILMFILNLCTVWAGDITHNAVAAIAGYCSVFYAIMFLVFILNLAVASLIILPLSVLKLGKSYPR